MAVNCIDSYGISKSRRIDLEIQKSPGMREGESGLARNLKCCRLVARLGDPS